MTEQKTNNGEVRRMQRMEISILLGVVLFVLASPLILRPEGDIEWDKAINRWIDILPYLLLLGINHFLLVPVLFFRKKRARFIVVGLILVSLTGMLKFLSQPPDEKAFRTPPPHTERWGPNPRFESGERPPHEDIDEHRRPKFKPFRSGISPFPPFINAIVISILLLLIDTGFRSSFRLVKTEYDHNQLEKENIRNRLSILKNQVSPHFFMNTLNNVHALIEVNPEEAQHAIIKLSKLMRAMLQEPDSESIRLKDEISIQKNYVELMGIRYNHKLDLQTNYPDDIAEQKIPPLLFTSLIENAFKYGVSYKADSFIHISMEIKGEKLKFEIANSNHKKGNEPTGGIGLTNVRDRLQLLYQSDYEMVVKEEENKFTVQLTIPL
ncbi:MAG: histidine kinase [Reichenbachiella sp.]|uniref:sensor histidine kinase n=1 Tax=Reichenbachiella sp. TaxID=2184521 RepID=UPI0032663341